MDTGHHALGASVADQIDVVSWEQLQRLPDTMEALAREAQQIIEHARRWVCRTEGFEPSPLCVLRPVVPVLHLLSAAFEDLGRQLDREWGLLIAGVDTARVELQGCDQSTAVAMRAVPGLPGSPGAPRAA